MIQVYVKLIFNGRRTIDQVPASIRDEVIRALTELGYEFKY